MHIEAPRRSLYLALLLCALLSGGLVYDHLQSAQRAEDFYSQIDALSQSWHDASQKLEEQRLVNQKLERQLVKLSQPHPAPPAAAKVKPAAPLVQAPAIAKAPAPDRRIQDLQDDRDQLGVQLTDVTESLHRLEANMAETQRRLDASEGDREALLRRLKSLQAQKSDLEHQFYDLTALHRQIRQLRDEQAISRRLAWIRRGLFGDWKGSEMLRALASAPPVARDYNLDVELHSEHPQPVSR